MDESLKARILEFLDGALDMTLATIRDDGYPQATVVGFVHDDLTIYFGCDEDSQKAENIARNSKVSLTVTLPYKSWNDICGLSAGADAHRITDPGEIEKVGALMFEKFPQIAEFVPSEEEREATAMFRVTPKVFSVIDYSKGFGHAELVAV